MKKGSNCLHNITDKFLSINHNFSFPNSLCLALSISGNKRQFFLLYHWSVLATSNFIIHTIGNSLYQKSSILMNNSPLQFQINYCMPCCLKDVCFNKPVLTLWSTPSRTSRSRPCRFSWSCPVFFWPTSSWWPSGVCVAAGSHGKHSEVDHQSPPTVKYTMSNLHPTYRYIVSIIKFYKALLQA